MKKITMAALGAGLFTLQACKNEPKTVTFTYEQKSIEFLFEPPYAGPDTKSAEVNLNLDSAFTVNKADITKIDKVQLENISFDLQEGKNFDNFGSATVEFQSDNADVKTITVGNMGEIPKSKTNISFAGSEKKNADDFFNQKKFFVLLSSNMKAEDTLTYKIKGNLKFKVIAAAKK